MESLEHGIFWLTLAGLALGSWSIYWARTSVQPARVWWGQGLFLTTCLGLGVCLVIGASCQATGLAIPGLCLGLLLVGMLWEAPVPEAEAGAARMID